ncbi:hypothetical protein K402DRAFT_460473 [Aulographum hederae CBS 113979]|uniref:Uncharacterized protein n=1 Tax=Aulographum hederae CBS 113979 TaxID=1176131 RepID=A0A6G1HBE8_9PEZI|nr:hypothetical protein K402DRAFT_460473 [Aulographum hederae CBS 113979]
MAPITPTPLTWTIRLKHAKTTVFLHIHPSAPISSLKSELLHALTQTCPDGHLNGLPLPQSPEGFVLGIPRDARALEKGWVRMAGQKGKGKEREGGGALREAGVRDGMAVAFRWGEKEDSEGDSEEEDDVGGAGRKKEEMWDVELPVWDDGSDEEGEQEDEEEDEEEDEMEDVEDGDVTDAEL